MSKGFTVDVSDKQDRTFYVYVVEGDAVNVATTHGGATISGSWISKSSGTDEDLTLTSGLTGYYKTTITGMSGVVGDVSEWTITFTFPRDQESILKVNASEVNFIEEKEVIVAASATPDYPTSVIVQDYAETSPEIAVNENYQLTGQDDHLLTASYLRISTVKFAAEQNSDGYTRTPQTIDVSYSDGVIAKTETIAIVADASNALIDNYAKEYELSDNQSEEKRSYTVSNWCISATWEQGPGWYRTITYPYVWLTGVDVWVSRALDQWGNESLQEGTIEYRHGTDYGYYITVPWLCSEVHLYGVVCSYGEGSEPTSSEIAWNGREFDQRSGTDCDQWVRFSSCQNTTSSKVTVKIENNLGSTSYSPPIYLIFEPNPDLDEAKLAEFGGNTKYAGDINGSVDFAGTGGLYEGVKLDEDQEYKTFSTYHYQVSPRGGSEAVLIFNGKTTEVALLTWGDSSAENESSKFWMSVEWEAVCLDGNVSLSISKQSQSLSVLSISATTEANDSIVEHTVYVRPTKQDAWISFVVAQNPAYESADEPEPEPEPEPTYTYMISPDPATIGAEGGTVEFTLTRSGSDGSVDKITQTVDVAENTDTEERTYTGIFTEWEHEFAYTIVQAAAEVPEPEPEPDPEPEPEPDPGTGDEPPDVQPTSGNAHVKYMQLSNVDEKRFGLTKVDVVLEDNERTDFSDIFAACEYLEEINEDVFSNCTNALSFENAFEGCVKLKEIPGKIFSWAKQATNFKNVFGSCDSLTSIPETIFQNNTRAVDFSWAFASTVKRIDSIPAGIFANCTRAENFSYTFCNTNITTAPASTFYSCLRATDFSYTFSQSNIKEIPGTLFRNNTKAKDFTGVFSNCKNLTEVGETLFDNCYRAESFAEAFYNDTKLAKIPGGLFRFMTSATSFEGVFGNCEKLSSIPADTFEKCISATDFSEAFRYDTGLAYVPDDIFKNCVEVVGFVDVFADCENLIYVPHDLFCATAKDADFGCALYRCSMLYQAGYNLYRVNENTYQLFATEPSASVLLSHSYLRKVYLWNLTSEGLEEMGEHTDFIPTVPPSDLGEVERLADVYIGKIITSDDRFAGALTGSDAEEIAASKLVSKLLYFEQSVGYYETKGYRRVYIGTCELGSKEFNSVGYVETAGTFVADERTLTLPSYEDVQQIYAENGYI